MHRVIIAQRSLIDRPVHARSRPAFTLVELLVVLVIIGMLASMVSFAMFRSMQAARQAKTQSLISKLHNVIARHWDTFETGQIPGIHGGDRASWVRAEMPDCEDDLPFPENDDPNLINLINQLINGNVTSNLEFPERDDDYPSECYTTHAQCLYQIVLLLADDDLDRINLFSENETKDLDGDGTPDCFIDAWGQPIGFIRQPIGFSDSDINDKDATNSYGGTGIYFPLIYSKGPDKKWGIEMSKNTNDADKGKKIPDKGWSLDNIHNHRMNARLQ